MRTILIMLAILGCKTSGTKDDVTIYVDGDAYRLVIHPIASDSQGDMFASTTALQLVVKQSDGTTTTHVLGQKDVSGLLQSNAVPPLEGAHLTLLGRQDSKVVYHGTTGPITATTGEHEVSIFVALNGEPVDLPSLPVPSAFSPMVATGGGNFYLFGGSDDGAREPESSRSIVHIDLSNAETGRTPSVLEVTMAEPETGLGWMAHTATLITGNSDIAGQVVIAGGSPHFLSGGARSILGGENASKQAFLFDPDTQTLTETDALSHKRYGHQAVSNHRGEVVVLGGMAQHDTSVVMAEFIEIFDPSTRRWSTRSDLLSAGCLFQGAARLGQQGVLVCGGINAQFEYTSLCQLVTPNGVLESADPLEQSLVWPHMVTLDDGRVLLTGGMVTDGMTFDNFYDLDLAASDRAWIYNAGTWREIGSMRNARAMHTSVTLPGGRVLIAGGVSGIDPNAERLDSNYSGLLFDYAGAIACAEIFDPETEEFTAVEPCGTGSAAATLPERTLLPAAASDPVYGALVAGGIGVDKGQSVDNVILFHPTYDGSELGE
jgi:hypothetical protein